MQNFVPLLLVATLAGLPLAAQERTPADSARADSIARADSLAIVRELAGDTVAARPAASNTRLLPDISVVGDFVIDVSPKGSTQEDGTRFGVREIEVAFQAAVDPYFRGDVFLGFSDEEGAAIEEAFLTATTLPYALSARLGRFLMPFGKQNTTHRHDLHAVEYPYVIQRFFGPEGLRGTGLSANRVFSPLGFYQELIVSVVDRLGEAPEDLTTEEPPNRTLEGLGYSARFRNYWDFTESSNLELSASILMGKIEQPVSGVSPVDGPLEFNAANVRRTDWGIDLTYRWRPLQQGLYKSFIFQAELMRQKYPNFDFISPPGGAYEGPRGAFTGGYVFARYQLSRRLFLGSRFDSVKDPATSQTVRAFSGYLQLFPSEFSKLMAAFERVEPAPGERSVNRILLQATFALGPHKPHPF